MEDEMSKKKGNPNKPPAEVNEVDPARFREAAFRIETEIVPSVYDLLERPAPNVTGDLKVFPRPSAEDQAAAAGVEVIRDLAQKAVLVLNTVASAAEHKQPINPGLVRLIRSLLSATEL